MSAPPLHQGIAVRYPGTGPDHDGGRSHIFVAISDITPTGDILLVSICSWHARSDETCIIQPADGIPGITHKSVVAYFHIMRVFAKNLIKRIETTEVTYFGPIPPATYARIKAGVLVSQESIPMFIKHFKAAHGIN